MSIINRLIETHDSFVNESLIGSSRAWSQPIQVIEFDNRKYEIRLQSTLIEDEYGKL